MHILIYIYIRRWLPLSPDSRHLVAWVQYTVWFTTMDNTIGDVPLEWYREEEHVGYDADGRKIFKPGKGDSIEHLLQLVDDPSYWRTVFDEKGGNEPKLSKAQVRRLNRRLWIIAITIHWLGRAYSKASRRSNATTFFRGWTGNPGDPLELWCAHLNLSLTCSAMLKGRCRARTWQSTRAGTRAKTPIHSIKMVRLVWSICLPLWKIFDAAAQGSKNGYPYNSKFAKWISPQVGD